VRKLTSKQHLQFEKSPNKPTKLRENHCGYYEMEEKLHHKSEEETQ
jgi:hypothetical protein